MLPEREQRNIGLEAAFRFFIAFISITIIYSLAGLNQIAGFMKYFAFKDESDTLTYLAKIMLPYALFITMLPSAVGLPYLTFKLYQALKSSSIYEDEILFTAKKYGKHATLIYFSSWILFGFAEIFQYSSNTGITLDFNQIFTIMSSLFVYAILVAISAYLWWDYLGIDWIISMRKGTTLSVPIGLSFRWKLIIIAYLIPLCATYFFSQLITTRILLQNNLFQQNSTKNLINIQLTIYISIILTWVPILIITLPILWREIQNVHSIKKSFERLKIQDQDEFSLMMLPVTTASDFGEIVSDYNRFITQLHARVLFSLESVHQLESFFNDLNEQIDQLVNAQEDIARSMEVTTNGVQHQSETLQEMTFLLNNVQNTFARLFQLASKVGEDISRLTIQIRIISLNARIEAARGGGGQDEHGATITFIAQRITQLSQEVKKLQDRLQEEFNLRLQEFSDRLKEVINKINDVQEIARESAANSEEVSAAVEEATATLHTTRDEAKSLAEQVTMLTRKLEMYSKIHHFN